MATVRHKILVGALGLAGGVLASLGLEFIIELAREVGVYDEPVERVARVMSLITSAGWFPWLGGAAIGFAIGVWIDFFLRRRIERRDLIALDAMEAPAQEVADAAKEKVSAHLRLQFGFNDTHPNQVIRENINNFYYFRYEFASVEKESGNIKIGSTTAVLVVLFDRYVMGTVSSISYINGAPVRYEVRHSSERFIFIAFMEALSNTTIEIRVNRDENGKSLY